MVFGMFTRQQLDVAGFCRCPGIYPGDFLQQLQDESELLIKRSYTQEELERHSVYPSDTGDARVSHAVMLSEGISDFPKVEHSDLPAVSQFLHDYHQILGDITGVTVSTGARSMLNYQNYFTGSKPVGEHFDGEYLRTNRASDGIEFDLEEGILPRYVSLLILANENNGLGTELVDNQSHAVHQPILNPGDLLFFDNIRLRHRVPTMARPRATIGVRSFDHMPLHLVSSKDDCLAGNYYPIAEGWVSEDVDCHARLRRFMDVEWPDLREDYAHYF